KRGEGVLDRLRCRVHRAVRPHVEGEPEPIVTDVCGHDVPRTDITRDGDRHEPDRPASSDKNVLARHGKGQRSVDCIAQWVENGGYVLVDGGGVGPDIAAR